MNCLFCPTYLPLDSVNPIQCSSCQTFYYNNHSLLDAYQFIFNPFRLVWHQYDNITFLQRIDPWEVIATFHGSMIDVGITPLNIIQKLPLLLTFS